MSATPASSKKRRSQSSKDASPTENSAMSQPMKLTQTQKRKRRRRVAKNKQKKKQPEVEVVKAQPTCLRLVLSAGKFCNLVGSALVAPFKSILRINSLEKQILVLQEQINQLQRAEKKRRGKRTTAVAAKPVIISTQSDVVLSETTIISIPIPPPMDDDAPPPPPMDGPEAEGGPPPPPPMTPEGQKVQSVKPVPKARPTEGKKEATASVGVTLADITNVKLRKASVPQVKPDGMGGITKDDILSVKLRKNSNASQDGKSLGPGGLNLEEIKGFKLKRTQNKSPGGTPRKSRRQVTSPDERMRAAAYAACAGGEGTASTQHAFAALRKKFLSSPRGAAVLQKNQDVGSNNNNEKVFSQLRSI